MPAAAVRQRHAMQTPPTVSSAGNHESPVTPATGAGTVETEEVQVLEVGGRAGNGSRPMAGGILIPSSVRLHLALWLPLILWTAVVCTGMAQFQGLPKRKRDVVHPLLWFDVFVFRTALGPALPFLVLTLRLFASAFIGNSPRHKPTFMPKVFWGYVGITLIRMAVYGLHRELQRRDGERGVVEAVAYMSDHILLGASVTACLHCELLCSLSDLSKLRTQLLSRTAWRVALAQLAGALALVCHLLVSVDMHYTARYFHYKPESLAALGLGLALFQVPVLVILWLSRTQAQLSVSRDED